MGIETILLVLAVIVGSAIWFGMAKARRGGDHPNSNRSTKGNP
jgi:hypothetical protein